MTGTAADAAAAAPPAPPTDLSAAAREVEPVDDAAGATARERVGVAAGRLHELAGWLAATRSVSGAAEGDGVPLRPRCLVAGALPAADLALADSLGVGVRGVSPGPSAAAAVEFGRTVADEEVETGTDLVVLGCGGVAERAADDPGTAIDDAIALVAVLGALEPVAVMPRGAAAVDTRTWVRRAGRLRDVRRDLMRVRSRPDELLRRLDPSLALLAGLLLRLTARRTPVVLDGLPALAVAMLVHTLTPHGAGWWQVADDGGQPAATRAAGELGLAPLLTLGVATPGATAGLLSVPLVRAAAGLAVRSAIAATEGTP